MQGYEVEIQSMGFDTDSALQTDKVDVTISAQSITEERLKAIDSASQKFNGRSDLAVRADNNDIKVTTTWPAKDWPLK